MKKLVCYFSRNFMLILLLFFCFSSARSQTKLVGTSRLGGNDFGTLFTMTPDSTTFANQLSIQGNKGNFPVGSLVVALNGKAYGMTAGGGLNQAGGIFEYDYLNNIYTYKIEFSAATGAGPQGSLTLAANGKLYGLTGANGPGGGGTIFEYDYNTNTFTKKIDLSNATGEFSHATLIEVSNGKLYGLTSVGGANDKGVIFEYDYNTNTYTKKIDLTAANGATPYGSLMKATNGKLYGLTSAGGANDKGVVFEYDYVNNIYTKKIDLVTTTGATPHGSLFQAGNGKLYGTTLFGGTESRGVLFEYDYTTNTYTDKFNCTITSGYSPVGNLMEAPDGKLYGITTKGGFSANTAGTIFQYDYLNNVFTNKVNLANIDGALGPEDGTLLLGSNGKLYGIKSLGGYTTTSDEGGGALFEYDYTNNIYIKKQAIGAGIQGENPIGALVHASNNKLYGVTSRGGSLNKGAVFEYNMVTNSYTKLADFNSLNGNQPTGSMTEASNGNLYGATGYGGGFGIGVIYEFNPSTNTLTKNWIFLPELGVIPVRCLKPEMENCMDSLYPLLPSLNMM